MQVVMIAGFSRIQTREPFIIFTFYWGNDQVPRDVPYRLFQEMGCRIVNWNLHSEKFEGFTGYLDFRSSLACP